MEICLFMVLDLPREEYILKRLNKVYDVLFKSNVLFTISVKDEIVLFCFYVPKNDVVCLKRIHVREELNSDDNLFSVLLLI